MIARQKVLRSGRLIATNYPGQHFPGLSSCSGAPNGHGGNEATPSGVGDVLMDAVLCDVPCSVRSVPCLSVCIFLVCLCACRPWRYGRIETEEVETEEVETEEVETEGMVETEEVETEEVETGEVETDEVETEGMVETEGIVEVSTSSVSTSRGYGRERGYGRGVTRDVAYRVCYRSSVTSISRDVP